MHASSGGDRDDLATGAVEAARRQAARAAIAAVQTGSGGPDAVRSVLLQGAAAAGVDDDDLLFGAFVAVRSVGGLHRLAPRVAIDLVLRLQAVLGPVGRARLVEAVEDVPAGAAHVQPVERFGRTAGAIVAEERGGPTARGAAFVREAAAIVGELLERDLMLERNAARERAVSASLERRLVRLAYDLHDGALQDLAALGAEVALFRRQAADVVAPDDRARVDGRFDDVEARLAALDAEIRRLLSSLTGATADEPLEQVVGREAAAAAENGGFEVDVDASGAFASLTESRRIAIFRVIQEALANVGRHSGAKHAHVEIRERDGWVAVSVEDDGRGFDAREAIADAQGRDRFGLAGMRERIRLLGGDLMIASRAGKGTRVGFVLAPWIPGSESDDEVPAAPA